MVWVDERLDGGLDRGLGWSELGSWVGLVVRVGPDDGSGSDSPSDPASNTAGSRRALGDALCARAYRLELLRLVHGMLD